MRIARKNINKLLAIVSVTTLIAAGTVPGMGQEPLDPGFEALVDRYLEAIHGVGANPEPDTMSAESFARQVQVSRDLLGELEAIDRDSLAFVQDIDWRFLKSRLEARIIEGERVQRWRQDPKLYLNNRDVAFKILADPRPVNTRAAELVDDLELLQVRLVNAETNLDQHIPRWVELANDFVDGFALVLQHELPPFAERVTDGGLRDRLLAAGKDGVAALAEYRRFINEDFPRREQGDYAIGAEVFNELMEKKYLFPVNDMHLRRIARGAPEFTRVPDYHEWGWKQFEIVRSHLGGQGGQDRPGAHLARNHPCREGGPLLRRTTRLQALGGDPGDAGLGHRQRPGHHSLGRRRRHHGSRRSQPLGIAMVGLGPGRARRH